MKIGIVCFPTFGGSGVVATELGINLAKLDHEIHFISYERPARLNFLKKNIYYHEVFVSDYPLFQYQPYELALSGKIANTVVNYNLELLHVHYAIPHAYTAYMTKQILRDKGYDIKVVTTLHGTDITVVGRNPIYKEVVAFSIEKSDAVTAVSNDLKNETISFFDIKKDISVIPNFINQHTYENVEVLNRELIARCDERIITHISNFRKVKNVEDVIDTFNIVQKKIKSRLILIGEGPEKERIEIMVNDLNLEKKVCFLGKIIEIESILTISDLLLLPSEKESFGLVALEAMAAKTPVISSNTGGLPEINVNGETGYLSNVKDVESMSENAIKILGDQKTLDLFKTRAFQRSTKFRIENILPMYLNVYKSVLN
ncbi:N-acetyl-alpha-D-glucosaminyl L-malate synthase BshA [Ichthyobacterium seriolicida]|uniref:Glycosyl transferase group 1 n=1 Tax=Ichthyobacterium seriolicida TaxID=242600 RepID=A0A1J1E239_9FLAO|nr:N-acetyl-alpha-D-glucosaminyl L-malate synthase BshA [Ichthyobacterium seriolicida]BAV95021.1 glycosyl transferase group 1 [Ichthyobacterium seriolicida]